MGLYIPLLAAWLDARGLHGGALGLVYSSLPAMGVVAPPILGVLADRFGIERSLLVVLLAGTVVSFGLMAVFSTSLGPLVACVVLLAFFRSPIMTLADATTLDLLGAGRYARMRVFGSSGFALAALFVAPRLDVAHPTLVPVVAAAMTGAGLLLAFRMPRASRPPQPTALAGAGRLLRDRSLLALLLAVFFGQLAHSAYDLCFSLHVRDLIGAEWSGPAWAIGVVAEIAVMANGPRIFARFGAAAALAFGFAASALRLGLLWAVRDVRLVFALQPLHALSFALPWIAAVARGRELAGTELVATAQSLLMASYALGATLGMPIWSRLYASQGPLAFLAAAPAALAAALVAGMATVRSARVAPE